MITVGNIGISCESIVWDMPLAPESIIYDLTGECRYGVTLRYGLEYKETLPLGDPSRLGL